MDISIRPAKESDNACLARIYNHYVSSTCITFETDSVSAADMSQRVSESVDASLPWLVAEASGDVVGYAYATKWKGRCAYRFSVESTVYLDVSQTGKGIGLQLYTALISAIRATSMHAVIGQQRQGHPPFRISERCPRYTPSSQPFHAFPTP